MKRTKLSTTPMRGGVIDKEVSARRSWLGGVGNKKVLGTRRCRQVDIDKEEASERRRHWQGGGIGEEEALARRRRWQ